MMGLYKASLCFVIFTCIEGQGLIDACGVFVCLYMFANTMVRYSSNYRSHSTFLFMAIHYFAPENVRCISSPCMQPTICISHLCDQSIYSSCCYHRRRE